MGDPVYPLHPIEVESYRILHARVDLSGWGPGGRDVVARMIHATADESFATSTRIGATAVAAATGALRQGAVVVCDAHMVAAGVPGIPGTTCLLSEVLSATAGSTRSAAAIRLAAARFSDGAIWVIGNAPTALSELLDLSAGGRVRPGAVIGLPVGYVGAAEVKARLWASPLGPISITNVGSRGGSAVAAAALNALHRLMRTAV
ncbi:MAG: precorrin-8X methylmutase [Actinomycetota bacterium]|nr:precorrin-8X methylmutase [Actinomycetota bacterium]